MSSSSSSQARIRCVGVHQGFLSVLDYEIGCLKWARHIPMLYPLEYDMLCGFIRVLALKLYLASKHLIAVVFFIS